MDSMRRRQISKRSWLSRTPSADCGWCLKCGSVCGKTFTSKPFGTCLFRNQTSSTCTVQAPGAACGTARATARTPSESFRPKRLRAPRAAEVIGRWQAGRGESEVCWDIGDIGDMGRHPPRLLPCELPRRLASPFQLGKQLKREAEKEKLPLGPKGMSEYSFYG